MSHRGANAEKRRVGTICLSSVLAFKASIPMEKLQRLLPNCPTLWLSVVTGILLIYFPVNCYWCEDTRHPMEVRSSEHKVIILKGTCGTEVHIEDLQKEPEIIFPNHSFTGRELFTLILMRKNLQGPGNTLHWMLINVSPLVNSLTTNKNHRYTLKDYTPPINSTASYSIIVYNQTLRLEERHLHLNNLINFDPKWWESLFHPHEINLYSNVTFRTHIMNKTMPYHNQPQHHPLNPPGFHPHPPVAVPHSTVPPVPHLPPHIPNYPTPSFTPPQNLPGFQPHPPVAVTHPAEPPVPHLPPHIPNHPPPPQNPVKASNPPPNQHIPIMPSMGGLLPMIHPSQHQNHPSNYTFYNTTNHHPNNNTQHSNHKAHHKNTGIITMPSFCTLTVSSFISFLFIFLNI